jgi:UDP-3-O-[3-hydroxymyristoyl] glucosamine N-acyltransferase
MEENAYIVVDNPRLAFAKVLAEFFVKKKEVGIGQNTVIDPTARIGKGVIIGNNCALGRDVVIGDYTEIHNNVVLADGVKVGKYCRLKSNSVIGEKGFGFPFAEDGTPVELPHLASVRLADYVEIGALNTVVGGALSDTIIHSHVKTDDHVHIAHNCEIGARTVITACSEISGSVKIGERCWLSPNCSIMNKINIGDDSFIGLGAVVIKDVPAGAVMAGNPAKMLKMKNGYRNENGS